MLTFVIFLVICFYIAHLLKEFKKILFYPIILSKCDSEDFSEKEEISFAILLTISSKLLIYFFSDLMYKSRLLDFI